MNNKALQPGDHLVSSRFGYTHHGIYVGDGMAIHYSGFADGMNSDGEISYVSLDGFRNGSDLWVQPHPAGSFDRQTVVNRAHQRLGEDWYNVLLNNCEHFANWCVRGAHSSPQVNALIAATGTAYAARVLVTRQASQTVVRHFAGMSTAKAAQSLASRSVVGGVRGSAIFASASSLLGPIGIAVGVASCLNDLYDWF